MTDPGPPPIPKIHTEETIRSIAQFRVEHLHRATLHQRAVDRITAYFAHPHFVGSVSAGVLGWTGFNTLMSRLGHASIDPPPFIWLGFALALLSLYMIIAILWTQRHDDRLAEHCNMLMLEMAILSEQKTAKVIQLLEEIRRDNPHIHDRIDTEAQAMAQPVNPQSVLNTIKQELGPTTQKHPAVPINGKAKIK